MKFFLEPRHSICLWCVIIVNLSGSNTTKYGINSLNFRGAMFWNGILKIIKYLKTIQEFQRKLKKNLMPYNCDAFHF